MEIQGKIENMATMIREIHHVVIGSEHDKNSGLLERVRRLESKTDNQDKLINKAKWLIIGMSAPASWGIIQFLINIIIK